MTCFNRKAKTLNAIGSLLESVRRYSKEFNVVFYITNDGCTDGTPEAIRERYADEQINIIEGDGNLYWAGGMRAAWRAALADNDKYNWTYYFLYNDDTKLFPDGFKELMDTHIYCLNTCHKTGFYSGITCDSRDHNKITYGGDVFLNSFTGRRQRLGASDVPQLCDFTNANAVLLSSEVVKKIGIFYEGYRHGAADFDYSFLARKAGFPVLITAHPVGECDNDHESSEDLQEKILSMSLSERKKHFSHPIRGNHDYEVLIRRTQPLKYPITWIFRRLNIYFPKLYYKLNGMR